jgi:hypothetical protein
MEILDQSGSLGFSKIGWICRGVQFLWTNTPTPAINHGNSQGALYVPSNMVSENRWVGFCERRHRSQNPTQLKFLTNLEDTQPYFSMTFPTQNAL